jgi:hypothetical protein
MGCGKIMIWGLFEDEHPAISLFLMRTKGKLP